MLIPSDVVSFGTITGRTSGLITTVPNASQSKLRKLGATIKYRLNSAPEGYVFVGFDFSGLEAVIAAAYEWKHSGVSLKDCPAAQRVFFGKSEDQTDVHSIFAKELSIPRATAKTLFYASAYGSGVPGLTSLLRVQRPAASDNEQVATEFLSKFKGQKIRGTRYFENGLFSNQNNFCVDLITQPQPTLPFLGTQITTALWPSAVGSDYWTGRMNWTIQASGGEIHDWVLVKITEQVQPLGSRFYVSCHDDLRWLVPEESAELVAEVCRKKHAEVWKEFFTSLGLEAPTEVRTNVEIDIAKHWVKDPSADFNQHRDNLLLTSKTKP